MRVAVALEGDVTTRAAHSLSAHPDIEVVVLAPAKSTQFEVVDSPVGSAAVFGRDVAVRAATVARLPVVTSGEPPPSGGVGWASIEGLTLALAAEVDDVRTLAAAIPGESAGDHTIVFPSPIHGRTAEKRNVGGRDLHVAGGEGPLAAALAFGPRRHRVIMDHHAFMEAIALAAGIGILLQGEGGESVAVWERPGPYLRAAAEMGLVIGERAPV